MAGPSIASFVPFADSLNFQSVVLFFVVFFVLLKLLFREPKNLPPGPAGWPVVGTLPELLTSKKHPHVLMTDWARRHGSVTAVRFRPGQGASVVLSDIHAVREALIKKADHFSDRFAGPLTKQLLTVHGSYLWESGDASKEHRRFGLSALRSLGVGKKSLENKINEEIRYLVECFESQGNRPFDPLFLVHNAVANIICIISFGYRFDYADPKFRKLLGVLRSLFEGGGFNAIGNTVPILISTPLYSKTRDHVKSLKNFISGIIQEHKDSYDSNDVRDIIDMYINETKQREQDGTGGAAGRAPMFTDQHMWRGIVDLFGAGTDTTSNTVLWMMLHVLKYPEIQDKIQREISDVIGGDRQPSCEDRPYMPYTNAVIMEVQRCRPVAPIAVPYKTSQETHLFGYTIPKGTMVIINLWGVMHDPKVWERPDEFDPGRFLTEDGQKVVNHEAFIPFGIGRRGCLGENLAKTELFLFITNLFQRFTFKSPPGAPTPSLTGVSGFTFVPEPFEICAIKR